MGWNWKREKRRKSETGGLPEEVASLSERRDRKQEQICLKSYIVVNQVFER